MSTIIRRQSVTDQIVAVLRERIIRGELADGTPLRQETLAAELGVSRVPLREAIRQLEAEGFVTSALHRGAVVRAMKPDELRELFDIRLWLEPELFALAIPCFSAADLDRAEAVLEASTRPDAVANWAALNWQFHEALLLPSGRVATLRLLRTVHDNANRYINTHIAVATDVARELVDHRLMLDRARDGAAEAGADLLRAHIQRVATNLVAQIGS